MTEQSNNMQEAKLDSYVGQKLIGAEPMLHHTFLKAYKGVSTEDLSKQESMGEGYHVVYRNPEGLYHSWSPKVVFEQSYFKSLEDFHQKGTLIPLDPVHPSDVRSVQAVVTNDNEYNGAHVYRIMNCLGFSDGITQYQSTYQTIQFVKKFEDGTVVPGLQSEQLLIALIDRHKKLDAMFPSEHNKKMIRGMEMALEAMEERVNERIERGVMGELKK